MGKRKLRKLEITEANHFEPLERFEALIRGDFVGQEWAVREILRRVAHRHAGLSDPNLPIANIFIAGPTGVGKTEFAKILASCFKAHYILFCPIRTCGWEIHEQEVSEGLKRGDFDFSDAQALSAWLTSSNKKESPLRECPRCKIINALRRIENGVVGTPRAKKQNNLISIDCGQYGETQSHNISRLVGAPPGYIGYSEKPLLHPRNLMGGVKVVLWDEFDKGMQTYLGGPTDLLHAFLTILDEGKITITIPASEGLNPEVSFGNVINILTSNIGTDKIMARFKGRNLGFLTSAIKPLSQYNDAELKAINDSIYRMVRDEVKERVSPELFNRITHSGRLIVFRFLRDAEYIEILNKQVLNKLQGRLNQRGLNIQIEYSPEALELILRQTGEDRQYGARPLKALAKKWIEDKLADFINYRKIKSGDRLVVKTEIGLDEELNEERERLAFFLVENGQDQEEKT